MNILTKICVVLLVVTSLVASVVFISLATAEPNYRSWYDQEKQAYNKLESTCRGYMESTNRLREELNSSRKDSSGLVISLRSKTDALVARNRALEVRNAGLLNDIKAIDDNITFIEKDNKAKQAFIESLQGQLRTAWARDTKLQQEKIRLTDDLKQEQARSDRLEKNNRVLKEQSEDLKNTNLELTRKVADLEARGGAESATAEEHAPPAPSSKLTGTVTAVRNNVASVNIGSAQGLKKGMRLIVFRGDAFVGYLKIERVDIDAAAGIMTKKKLAPMQGDKVTSSLD